MERYFVDYENVKFNGLDGIETLSKNNSVHILYSSHVDTLKIETHLKLLVSKAKIEWKEVSIGKQNALDFQLATFLGAEISKNPYDKFYIVSKDTGFDFICGYWRKENIEISRVVNLIKEKKIDLEDELKKIIVDPQKRKATVELINKHLETKEFHNGLQKIFNEEKDKETLKTVFKNYKNKKK